MRTVATGKLKPKVRRPSLGAEWVCHKCGTHSARSYNCSAETGKSDFYVKSHHFKFSLKLLKHLYQSKIKGIYRQECACRYQFSIFLPYGTMSSLKAWSKTYSLVYTQSWGQWLVCNTFSLNFGSLLLDFLNLIRLYIVKFYK